VQWLDFFLHAGDRQRESSASLSPPARYECQEEVIALSPDWIVDLVKTGVSRGFLTEKLAELSGAAAHREYVQGDGGEDQADAGQHGALWKDAVELAGGINGQELDEREESYGFCLDKGDHAESQMLEAGLVLAGDADGVVEDGGIAADRGDKQVEDESYGGENKQHPGRPVGVGMAGEVEVRGDGTGEWMGAVEGGVSDPEEDGEGG